MKHPRQSGQGRCARRLAGCAFSLVIVLMVSLRAVAGGGPENVLLVIDPANAESTRVGHYYKQARQIPDANVLYMQPTTNSYIDFVDFQLDAFLGTMAQRGITETIDYVVIPPGAGYRTSADGLVTDLCVPVRHFAATTPFVAAYLRDVILSGTSSARPNRYYGFFDNEPVAFDAGVGWFGGQPSESTSAQRYFISFMLGYSGNRGNTIDETMAMIDRSVAADGTHPAGTFYYMETTDKARSEPRDGFYPQGVEILAGLGMTGAHLFDVLPEARDDCLGVMTGWADPRVIEADMKILPGAFCDHLTSFAGFFGTSSQTKISEWIAKGASGSVGAVEEPCNFATKFPHPRLHIYYAQGASLGEATFRSLANVPFQMLMYGDPLTQPFAHFPTVSAPDAPSRPVSGQVSLTPVVESTRPGGGIARVDLFIDGVQTATRDPGEPFNVDTTELADGWHELRVVAFDDAPIATQGRWIGSMMVDNAGRSTSLTVDPASSGLDTLFNVSVSAAGAGLCEIRLVQHGRVIAGTQETSATFTVHAAHLGAGPTRLQAVADFVDGGRAQSEPIMLDVSPRWRGTAVNVSTPVAYSYTNTLQTFDPVLIDLPATDADGDPLSIEILDQPTQSELQAGGGAFLLRPNAGASGVDEVSFRASDGENVSGAATVTIRYPGDTCSPAGLLVSVEIEALTNMVEREVMYQLGGCDGGGDVFGSAPVVFDADGMGTFVIGDVPAGTSWVRIVEGHTLPATRSVQPNECGLTVVNFTGPDRLRVGDLQTSMTLKDGVVDVGDFSTLAAGWEQPINPEASIGADVNGDGLQDATDFAAMIANYAGLASLDDVCSVTESSPRATGETALRHWFRRLQQSSHSVAP